MKELTPQIDGKVIESSLDEVLHSSMIPYAEYVILDRALPRVEDGLKPVQRRILYSMLELGLQPDKPFRKSARIVGDCLGKYHPHGDTSVYDAMVRMAQDFNMRMPLVDGHGNFGSVDGDPAAAMRYTEARMTSLALDLLKDLEKNTVKFSLNFDDTIEEPDLLPAGFPNLLVNGASGIAIGLATNIPPHNLGEVIDGTIAYIENPKMTLAEMMKYIKGPDFPTGGYLIGGEDLVKAYETGRGKVTMRAKLTIEPADNDKKDIVITELPYQVNKARLLEKILKLKEEKKELLAGIHDIVDESDRNGMRAVIRIKKDYDPKQILEVLYKYSELRATFGINMVAICEGKPQQMGLLDIIRSYVEFRRDVIVRRTKFDYDEAKAREHILEGLVIAVKNIDEVVQIIKKSENTNAARQNLRERFALSDKQAQAILDMRLARLTSLEVYKLEKELEEVRELIAKLKAILDSKKLQMKVVEDELKDVKKRYRDDRRTVIFNEEDKIAISSYADVRPVQPCVVTVNADGGLKRVNARHYSLSQTGLADGAQDNEIAVRLLPVQDDMAVLLFSNLGNAFKLDVKDLPDKRWREKGAKLSGLFKEADSKECVLFALPYDDKQPQGDLLFFTRDGYVKKTSVAEYVVAKAVFAAVKLKEGDELINVEPDREGTTLVFVTRQGYVLNADKTDLPAQGRVAGGVHGVALGEGDACVFAGQAEDYGEIFAVTDRAFGKRVIVSAVEPLARYRKGVKLMDLGKDNGEQILFANYVTVPYDLAVSDKEGTVAVNTEDIPIENRGGKGKALRVFRKAHALERIVKHESL